MSIEEVKMTTRTSSGTLHRVSATLEYADGRIFFLKSPYSLKDEIKAMARLAAGTATTRNSPAEDLVRGGLPAQPLPTGLPHAARMCTPGSTGRSCATSTGSTPQWRADGLMPHQYDLADAGLTYHYQIFGGRNGHRQDTGCPDGD